MMRGNYFYKRLGEHIGKLRKQRKFSQEQLAMVSEIDRTYLSRIEDGKANPSIKVLNKISKNLRIKLETLLRGS